MIGAANVADVRLHPQARAELIEAVRFYESRARSLGREFLAEVRQVSSLLRDHPEAGAPYTGSTRRLILRRFPYTIIYTYRDAQIVVLAVAHQRRRPGYWQARAPTR